MSLRELPPKQSVSGRWRRLRYVPLVALVVLAILAAATGAITVAADNAKAAAANLPAAVGSRGSAERTRLLPAICRPPVPRAAHEPWLGSVAARAQAESVWSAHASELNKPYVEEKNGWYDLGDVQANNFSQALGRRNLSVDEANKWHAYFARLQAKLATLDIPLYIVITPAKWDVYPQELPDWAQSIRGSDSLDQLLARSDDLPIVDVRIPLRIASTTEATFSKTNSHWTDYGAAVAWQSITACIDASSPALSSLSALPISGVTTVADRNEFAPFGVPDPAPDWTIPNYATPLKSVVVTNDAGISATQPGATNTDLLALPVETNTPGALTALSALVVRDSFGNALSVPIQQSFATSWQVRHNFDSTPQSQPDIFALAEKDHPSVVILQIAERHLNFVPAS